MSDPNKQGERVELGSASDVLVQQKEPGFIQKGALSFTSTIKEAADWRSIRRSPYRMGPALILVSISFFQIFDSAAYSAAAPEIVRTLHIEIDKLIQVTSVIGFFLIFVGMGVAHYSDRHKRVPLVGIFNIIAGIFSFGTSRVQSLSSLGVSRGTTAIGEQIASVPRFSLLADYYPPETRGKVFAMLQTLRSFGTVIVPLLLLPIAGRGERWRLPFVVSGAGLIFIGILAMLRLREPVRGEMERRSLGAEDDVAKKEDDPLSFGESWRTIWAVRTLRRFFIADALTGWAFTLFSLLYSLFLQEKYGLDYRQRVLFSSVTAVFVLLGGFFGGGLVDVLTRRRPQRVLVVFGVFTVSGAILSLFQALGPPLWLLLTFNAMFLFASALVGPAGSVVYAQVIPANSRSLGLAVQSLSDIPGTIIRFTISSYFIREFGVQGGLISLVPFMILGGIVQMSAAGFFERDMRSAFAASLASEEWRKAKRSGKGKLLVCRDVDVEYDGVQVLFGVDFDVEEGQIIALLGTNGAGKSTLLRAISGTQEASAGAIVFDGRDITHMPPHEIAGRNVIHMPGGRGVFPGLTVRDNLMLGNWMAEREDQKVGRKDLKEVYQIFPILEKRQNELASSLSGGEQQMLSLAQAFLGRPRLLMIDELSLGLSPAVVQELVEIVKEFNRRGITIIIVEQSVNVALTVADRAIFMEKGEVRFFGETKDLLTRPDILRAVYVKGSGSLTDGAPATAMKSQRELRRYELEQSRPILQVQGLTKSFGGVRAVDGVSFELREGESLGLIGPNGAGKTTIFEMISGYQMPDEGKIILEGIDVTTMRPDERATRRMIRRFQDAKMFPSLTVYENILVALERKLEVRSLIFTALQVPQVRQSEKRVRARAESLIELLELGAFRDKFVRELSTGLRRIADLACVLAAEPKVLLLDEPSSGIAQAEAEGLAPLLRRVKFETGCSLLIIEHDMPLISAISDELIALDQGRVVVRGVPDDVLNDERVIESYLGTSDDVIQRSGVRT